ncbi:hypothetical protein FHS15_003653 [Paenibacillus castaneae]|uniref:cadherin-like beta sandwich domain-containing protein n=1 Tax=Paenibacillus castaneae TaxID=474957 RepID=UPI000C9CEF69|nr:cadherin-like beta sandwich domain-containing protein [Paenibacillus castaneae]NIK78515.1 hypothetical protein [Paenibacillus castaneae]
MVIKRVPGSLRVLLKGFMVRLLLGLMVFSLFSSSLALPASAAVENTGPDGSPGWTYCADEGAGSQNTCSFEGTKEVRYWGISDSYNFISKIVTNSTACSNEVFGDPQGGIRKKCFYRDVQLDSGEMTKVVQNFNKTLTITFNVYAAHAGTLEDLKSKILVKRTSMGDFIALGEDDTVTNSTYTATSSTLEINFKDTLVGLANAIKIEAGAFNDSDGEPYSKSLEINNIQFIQPSLTADITDNNNMTDIEITFADNALWREAITAVMDGARSLVSGTDYSVHNGKITIKAGVLQKGNHSIVVKALGYPDASVNQIVKKVYIGAGKGMIENPYLIETAAQLDDVRNQLDNDLYFKLTADIDLSSYASWEPIGNDSESFKGNIDGNGYKIKNLRISQYYMYVGLFGISDNMSTISNMRLENINVNGYQYVGGLIGQNNGNISNSYASGIVSGSYFVGGLVGNNRNEITGSYTAVAVSGIYAGGLVGYNEIGTISNSYATGDLIESTFVGGLVGYSYFGSISDSYALGSVSGEYAGGLVGELYYTSLNNSFYDNETTNQKDSGKGVGRLTAEMKSKTTFSDWNFTSDWYMLPDHFPQLWAFIDLTKGIEGGTTKINHAASGMEYSVNDGIYNVIDDNNSVNIPVNAGDTITVRIAADVLSAKTLTVKSKDIKPGSGPTTAALAVGTDSGTTKITGVTSAMEYKVNNGSYVAITGSNVDNIAVNAAETISIRLAEGATQPASLDQTLTITLADIKSAAAPTTGVLTQGTIGETTKLSGVTATMEYKVNNDSYKAISKTREDNITVKDNDTISVRVAATALQPESEPQTLTVQSNVRNPKSADATLSALTLSGVTLSPTFASGTLAYTANVANNVTSTTVAATKVNTMATISEDDLGLKSLRVGANTMTIHVTAEDGITKKNYSVMVTRAQSTDATLSELSLSGATLSPTFASGTLTYTAIVANNVTSTTVSASTSDAAATITAADLGSKPLSVGANVITVHVTAEDGTTNKYTVTLTRAKSSDATLSTLTLSGVTLSPTFASGTLSYTANVANDVVSTTVAATKGDTTATITTADLGSKPLSVGVNVITVHVTAEDGTTNKYTVIVTRAQSTDATLSELSLSGATLSPTFASGTLTYTANVANNVTSTTVSASTSDAVATIAAADLGSKQLIVGENTFTVHVTAEDGITNKNYTVTVTRAASSDAALSALALSGVTMSPTFDSDTLAYTADVANNVTSTIVEATQNDATATISADDLGSKQLLVGENIITVHVRAEDGTTKNYTVTVIRAQSSDAALSELTLSGVTLSPKFTNGRFAYTGDVANNVTSTTITATKSDKTAAIAEADLGSKLLSVGVNTFIVHVTAEDGITKKEYTVIVRRAQSSDAALSELTLSGVTMNPTFDSGTLAYTANVASNVTSMTVTATKSDATATINETDLGLKQLTVGENTFIVHVTAEDGITKKEYTITVTRAKEVESGGGGLPIPTPTPVPTPIPTPVPTPTPTINLGDISRYWAEDNIKQAASLGIVSGYPDGTFKPNHTVTRGEFAVMLMNLLKPQEAGAELTFADTAKIPAWAQKAIALAVQAGIINGYEDGTFRPDAEITRAEMAVILAKALGKSTEANAATSFADDNDIPAWAKASVAYVKQAGIVKGKGNNEFAPQDHATRAEAVTVLLNILAQWNK